MTYFTARDASGLKVLVDHHKVVYRRNAMLSRLPHVGAHTSLTVCTCTDEYEFRDPVRLPATDGDQLAARRDLEDLAIVTAWTFTRTGCDHVVSCNPFYPKSKRCRGMAFSKRARQAGRSESAERLEPPEDAFSFRTLNGQRFDACQPMCYDAAAASLDNMVGVTSRFTFGKCRVYDPLIMAFYLDPTRRYVNPETQILERKSFVVEDVLIEPYKDAVLLARIPSDYCDQYADSYRADGREQGIDMYKCGENALVWSTGWLLGESVPKLAVLAYDKTLPYLTSGRGWAREEETRYPPTASREQYDAGAGKKTLPFPLRLSDLGIKRGTATEWLVWTDEFSHLRDGRNDEYGGRLVERARPVAVGVSEAAEARAWNDDLSPAPEERADGERRDAETPVDSYVESSMLKSISRGVEEYRRVLAEETERGGHYGALGVGAGLAYGPAYEYVARAAELPSSIGVLKSAFNALRRAPSYARRAALEAVGFWSAKAVAAHTTEAVAVSRLTSRLKGLAFTQALGPVALVVDVISLVGAAVDIAFVLLNAVGVSTPVSRRLNCVSDRRLYRLAQTEIEFNYRSYGVGNIELTPFRFLVNTPYVSAEEDIESYLAVMPIVYAAREINSDGGFLKPERVGGAEFRLGEGDVVHYVKNGVRHATVRDDGNSITSAVDDMVRAVRPPVPKNTVVRESSNAPYYYTIVLFVATCLVGFLYPSQSWTLLVALLVSVLSVAFPSSRRP